MNSESIECRVPFHKADVGEDEIRAIGDVIRSGWLTMGAKTFEFERRFAEYVSAKHAIAVSSCTAALHLCLDAIHLKPGDEVLVPTTTFAATAEVVTYFGAKPVFVDIEGRFMNIDFRDAASKITPRTRAIIPVHFAGQPCDLTECHALAEAYKIHVIEDAAHALPSLYRGKRIGSISELTAFSFYATKTITTGEGGMITTNNDDYAKRARLMRLHGITHDAWNRYAGAGDWYYEVAEPGFKYNLTDLQSAIGLVQLHKCDSMHDARRCIAAAYSNAFQSAQFFEIPSSEAIAETSWHLYVLRLRLDQLRIDRDQFVRELSSKGLKVSVHFIPLHLQPIYQRLYGHKRGDLPCSEREYFRSLSLPLFPTMSKEQIEYVISTVGDTAREHSR